MRGAAAGRPPFVPRPRPGAAAGIAVACGDGIQGAAAAGRRPPARGRSGRRRRRRGARFRAPHPQARVSITRPAAEGRGAAREGAAREGAAPRAAAARASRPPIPPTSISCGCRGMTKKGRLYGRVGGGMAAAGVRAGARCPLSQSSHPSQRKKKVCVDWGSNPGSSRKCMATASRRRGGGTRVAGRGGGGASETADPLSHAATPAAPARA